MTHIQTSDLVQVRQLFPQFLQACIFNLFRESIYYKRRIQLHRWYGNTRDRVVNVHNIMID